MNMVKLEYAYAPAPAETGRERDTEKWSFTMPRQYTPRVSVICKACGETFTVQPNVIAHGGGKYHNQDCRVVGFSLHGDSRLGHVTSEYRTWRGVKSRCLNPNDRAYPRYGGRGITICDRWRDSFPAFLADVGRKPSARHSIGRIDNDQGYSPENVRWETSSEQMENTRASCLITFDGKTQTVTKWARAIGVSRNCIRRRLLDMGWDVERALTTPSRSGGTGARSTRPPS